jgi:hypothetical protein
MWELICRIKPRSQAPWLMISDFNEALWSFEHMSGRKRSERQMLDFQEILSHYDLHDRGFIGQPWTFDNNQASRRNVNVRLDRAIASPSWSSWFPAARVRHIASSRSDHCPIALEFDQGESTRTRHRIARYELMWERDDTLPDEIKKAWHAGGSLQNLDDIRKTLTGVMSSLGRWSHDKFGAVTKELETIRGGMEEMSVLNSPDMDKELMDDIWTSSYTGKR